MVKTRRILFLFVIPFVIYVVTLGFMPLMDPDEGRYALIPQEMNARGDYITPYLKGVVYLEKPPLVYWVTAFFFRLLGENAFSARLAVGLSAWGLILLIYLIGRHFRGEETGLVSAAIFSVSFLPFGLGRISILDMPLTLFLSLAVWSGYLYFDGGREKRLPLYGMYFFSACAFLTKGMVGVVFPFIILVIWLLWEKRWRDVLSLFSPVGMFIFLACAGPWLWAVQKANPDFFSFFFLREHILRYTTTVHERGGPIYYFIPILIVGGLPWWFYLSGALKGIKKDTSFNLFREGQIKFLFVWMMWPFVFYSLSSSKLIPYILPSFPPLACLMGYLLLSKRGEAREGIWPQVQSFFLLLLIGVPFFVPDWKTIHPLMWVWYAIPAAIQIFIMIFHRFIEINNATNRYLMISFLFSLYLMSLIPIVGHYLTPGKSAFQVAQAVERFLPAGEEIYQFRMSQYSLDFYLGRRTPLVDEQGELAPGVKKLPERERRHYFPTSKEFIDDLAEGNVKYVLVDRGERVKWLLAQGLKIEVLWSNQKFYMFRLYMKQG